MTSPSLGLSTASQDLRATASPSQWPCTSFHEASWRIGLGNRWGSFKTDSPREISRRRRLETELKSAICCKKTEKPQTLQRDARAAASAGCGTKHRAGVKAAGVSAKKGPIINTQVIGSPRATSGVRTRVPRVAAGLAAGHSPARGRGGVWSAELQHQAGLPRTWSCLRSRRSKARMEKTVKVHLLTGTSSYCFLYQHMIQYLRGRLLKRDWKSNV